jgi:FkbM family methyltransferase
VSCSAWGRNRQNVPLVSLMFTAVILVLVNRTRKETSSRSVEQLTGWTQNRLAVDDLTKTVPCDALEELNSFHTGADPRRLRHSCKLSRSQGPLSLNDTELAVAHSDGKHVEGAFRSQNGEDQYLHENFFFMKENGTFVEMGALDGVRYSNSYFFERVLGWSGLLIEANPSQFKELVKNRGNVSACVHGIICDEPRDLHFVEATDTAVAGVWELMSPTFREKWHSHLTQATVETLPVTPCTTMQSILDRIGLQHADFFSLDVEGAESSVLESIDFSRFTASVCCEVLLSGAVQHGLPHPGRGVSVGTRPGAGDATVRRGRTVGFRKAPARRADRHSRRIVGTWRRE